MTKPISFPVCSVCNYDLSGITPEHTNQTLTCPECGNTLRPKHQSHVFTKKRLRKLLFRNLILYPSSVPVLAFSFLAVADLFHFSSEDIEIATLAFTLILGLLLIPFLLLTTTLSAYEHARPHPRPVSLRLIPVLSMLYLIPTLILYMGGTLLYARDLL